MLADEEKQYIEEYIDSKLSPLTKSDKEYIKSMIETESNNLKNFIIDLDKKSLKIRVFDLAKYGFTSNILAHQRYVALESNLINELEDAFFQHQYIVLQYEEVYWTLNSFQRTGLINYSFSFISIMTDPDSNGIDNYQYPIIQFILVMSNPNKEDSRNTIIKKSNTIRLSDQILTNDTLYEQDIFSHKLDNAIQNFENETGLKV